MPALAALSLPTGAAQCSAGTPSAVSILKDALTGGHHTFPPLITICLKFHTVMYERGNTQISFCNFPYYNNSWKTYKIQSEENSTTLKVHFIINVVLDCHLLLTINKIKFHHNLHFHLQHGYC